MDALKLCSLLFLCFLGDISCYYEGGITNLKFISNKYQYMVIYINDGVPETSDFVDKVKATFTAASKYLYRATRKRAFLGSVFIRIPHSWTKKAGYADAPTLISQPKADILISRPHPTTRNFPFTRSYAGCGHPGIHIQLNTDFLLKPGTMSSVCANPPICGKPDRFLVHEFATYRYGVFNEFPSPGEDAYYFSPLTGKLERVRCSLGQFGRLYQRVNGKLSTCTIDPDTGSYTDQCLYVAYPAHNAGTSSVMEYQWRSETVDFCDDTETDIKAGKYGHNREPHTQQNRLCAHRSTWDVITSTQDFVNNANPATNTYSDPKFSVFRATSRKRRAVVLSTTKDNRKSIHAALSRLLEDGTDDTDDVIIHSLDEPAGQELTRHIRVKHSVKEDNFSVVLTKSNGRMKDIIKSFVEGRPNDTSIHVLFVLCGNVANLTSADVQTLVHSDILPHVISCDGTGNGLERDVTDHGGLYHEVNKIRPVVSLHHGVDAFSHITDTDRPIQIVNEVFPVSTMTSRSMTFTLDEHLDGDLTLYVTYSDHAPKVVLYSPDGKAYTHSYGGYSDDKLLKVSKIRVSREEVKGGKWTYEIKNDGQHDIEAHVLITFKCEKERSDFCIIARSWWKIFNDEKVPRVGIYTEVLQGHHPVSGVNVTAYVTQEDGREHDISLFDNGAGADIEKDDGIYSRYLTHLHNSLGPYHVHVVVTTLGSGGHIVQKNIIPHSAHFHTFGITEFKYNISKTPLKYGLTRTTSAGSFKMPNHVLKRHFRSTESIHNMYPPSRIQDLRVIRRSFTDRTVVLQWTAPGGSLDYGKAHSYKLIYHHNTDILLDSPHEAYDIPERNILAGNISDPSYAGSSETYTILMPSELNVVGLRLGAWNKDSRESEFSNMVTIGFPESTKPETEGEMGIEHVLPEGEMGHNLPEGVVEIGHDPPAAHNEGSGYKTIVVAFILLVCSSLVVSFLCKRKRREDCRFVHTASKTCEA